MKRTVTLSAEQLLRAPSEVRCWIEAVSHGATALSAFDGEALPGAAELAAATRPEIDAVFEAVHADFIATHVLYELGRSSYATIRTAGFCAHSICDLLGRTRLVAGQRLFGPLETIGAAFQAVRGNPDAALFGLHPRGYIFVHAATQAQIAGRWSAILAKLDVASDSRAAG